MAPLRPSAEARYSKAAQAVLTFLREGGRESSDDVRSSISEVKGLFNRCVRQDQWDWFTVWDRLGLPERVRLQRMVTDLAALRNADTDQSAQEAAKIRLDRIGASSALSNFLSKEQIAPEDGEGLLYILSTREAPTWLKIGMTTRSVVERLNEINGATGVVIPFGVRHVWRVRDPAQAEREAHDLLRDFRIRKDREFFDVPASTAVKMIDQHLAAKYLRVRELGEVCTVLDEKGYGFIHASDGDLFFHASDAWVALKSIPLGMKVEFVRLSRRLGPAAVEVCPAR